MSEQKMREALELMRDVVLERNRAGMAWGEQFDKLMTALASADEALAQQPVKYGCHCDLDEGMEPDGCVIDEGLHSQCVHARAGVKKEDCEYWQPVKFVQQHVEAVELTDANTLNCLRALVDGLNKTYWSSWQTTAHFGDELNAANEYLSFVDETKRGVGSE